MSLPKILEAVETYLERFVAYPSESARVAHALWIAHAHCMDAWVSTPRLAFLSPEPGSGKSRALEATEPLVPAPVLAVNVTPAYLFRKVGSEDGPPTVLFDEIDTVFGPKARDNEELRGLLNAGHRQGAVAGRCRQQGKEIVTEEIPAYAAVAMAGLGELPDTILSRSIIVRMRRRASNEVVEPFRPRLHSKEGEAIRDRLAGWASKAVLKKLGKVFPDFPDGVTDRDADVWEPLLVLADEAGGSWPERARLAAVELVALAKDRSPSLGLRLLADIRAVFDRASSDQLTTMRLLDRLNENDEAPWGNLRGQPLDARGLARLLKPYEIKPTTIRHSISNTAKGYRRGDFHDAWDRYLPLSPPEGVTNVTRETGTGTRPAGSGPNVPDVTPVTLAGGKQEHVNPDVSDPSRERGIVARAHPSPNCDETKGT